MKSSLLILSLLFLTPSAMPQPYDESAIRDSLACIAQRHHVPLLQVAFRSPDFCLDAETGDSARQDCLSIFQAASLSKVVFAYLVMRLYDQGIIDLDQPLYKHISLARFEDTIAARKITARLVLTHRTGLPNWAVLADKKEWPTSTLRFRYAPDTRFSYSGEAFSLLQQAVEKQTGKSLEQLAVEKVFQPLGMQYSSFDHLPCYDSLETCGYTSQGLCVGRARFVHQNPAYTLRTNAIDYSIFLQALLTGKGLKPETHKLMLSPVNHPYDTAHLKKPVLYGLGIAVELNDEYGTIYYHRGDNVEYKCFFILIPSRNISAVYFTNSENGDYVRKAVFSLFTDTSAIKCL